jgi:hypothetical protein
LLTFNQPPIWLCIPRLHPAYFNRAETTDTIPASTRSRQQHLSGDGKWRSFSNVPNLLQYVGNGTYYGRIKIAGKVFRESLKTTV